MDKTKEKLFEKYIDFVTINDKKPPSVKSFMEELNLKETTFHKYFKSFEELEKEFWRSVFDHTLDGIQSQDVYQSYSVNEKLLAFYYSWIEQLKDYRDYALRIAKNERFYELYPSEFELFRMSFVEFAGNLVDEGLAVDEIANRQLIADKYKYLLWAQPVSIFKFWVKDESEQFEETDALIEKTVNFSFDLMRSNSLDSFFDLAKFHIQHF